MDNRIFSKDGDTLSGIAYRYYGSSAGQVERILAANPELCRQSALLPAGVAIVLPAAQKHTPTVPTLQLWD